MASNYRLRPPAIDMSRVGNNPNFGMGGAPQLALGQKGGMNFGGQGQQMDEETLNMLADMLNEAGYGSKGGGMDFAGAKPSMPMSVGGDNEATEGMDFANEPAEGEYVYDEPGNTVRPPLQRPDYHPQEALMPGEEYQPPTYPEEQNYEQGYKKRRGPGPWSK